MSVVSNIATRFVDLVELSKFVEGQMRNLTGGLWEKFYGASGTLSVPTKVEDYSVFDSDAIGARFDRAAAAALYKQGYETQASLDEASTVDPDSDPDDPDTPTVGGGAYKVISGKLQSDMLASMHQASGLRYTTRIRSVMATAARRRALWEQDFDNLMLMGLDKWV